MTIDIKALAKQAGGTVYADKPYVILEPDELAEFVRLVRESALEESAVLCDAMNDADHEVNGYACAGEIRSMNCPQ